MKKQIVRFSLHQNAKVLALLTAACSLVFIVPMVLFSLAVVPASQRPSLFMFLLMPVFYFVAAYLMVIIGCAVYNRLFPHIGGIEFESREHEG